MKILYVMELTRPASALGMKMPTQTMLAGLAGAMFLFVLSVVIANLGPTRPAPSRPRSRRAPAPRARDALV